MLFLIESLGGWTAAGNRDQVQVEIADTIERSVERRLVRERAGKQGLISFQTICQLQACKPIRPVWVQMAFDFDLLIFRQISLLVKYLAII